MDHGTARFARRLTGIARAVMVLLIAVAGLVIVALALDGSAIQHPALGLLTTAYAVGIMYWRMSRDR